MRTDLQIQRDVLDELKWEPKIDAAEIGVAVRQGIVTLTGTVSSYVQKQAAERAAWRVQGVKAVAEEIEVRLPNAAERTDEEIARAALDAVGWNVYLPRDGIKVKVEDGWVSLDGEVEWGYQRTTAENAVRHLTGVRGITNLILVRPRVSAAEVRDKIRKALERSADLDAKKISVETHGAEVVLGGNVRSFAERQDAERAAWSAPGVARVRNEIVIAG